MVRLVNPGRDPRPTGAAGAGAGLRAAWRLERAERERTWALVSTRAEGISIRKLAAAAGLSPSRVHAARGRRRPECAGRGARRAAGSGLAGQWLFS
jgi:hypothetical protein